MESRMTVVQALDERELLIKKIQGKMQKAQFVDLMKPKASVTLEKRVSRAAFSAQALSSLQQIEDMIARYDALNAAIIQSNAETFLETTRGRMSVSCAISLRNRLKGKSSFGEHADFEKKLAGIMEESLKRAQETQRRKNELFRKEKALAQKKGKFGRIIMLRNESEENGNAVSSDTLPQNMNFANNIPDTEDGIKAVPVKVFGSVGRKNQKGDSAEKNPDMLRIVDPLKVRGRAEKLLEHREALLMELETKIKISNATTYIVV